MCIRDSPCLSLCYFEHFVLQACEDKSSWTFIPPGLRSCQMLVSSWIFFSVLCLLFFSLFKSVLQTRLNYMTIPVPFSIPSSPTTFPQLQPYLSHTLSSNLYLVHFSAPSWHLHPSTSSRLILVPPSALFPGCFCFVLFLFCIFTHVLEINSLTSLAGCGGDSLLMI